MRARMRVLMSTPSIARRSATGTVIPGDSTGALAAATPPIEMSSSFVHGGGGGLRQSICCIGNRCGRWDGFGRLLLRRGFRRNLLRRRRFGGWQEIGGRRRRRDRRGGRAGCRFGGWCCVLRLVKTD